MYFLILPAPTHLTALNKDNAGNMIAGGCSIGFCTVKLTGYSGAWPTPVNRMIHQPETPVDPGLYEQTEDGCRLLSRPAPGPDGGLHAGVPEPGRKYPAPRAARRRDPYHR